MGLFSFCAKGTYHSQRSCSCRLQQQPSSVFIICSSVLNEEPPDLLPARAGEACKAAGSLSKFTPSNCRGIPQLCWPSPAWREELRSRQRHVRVQTELIATVSESLRCQDSGETAQICFPFFKSCWIKSYTNPFPRINIIVFVELKHQFCFLPPTSLKKEMYVQTYRSSPFRSCPWHRAG